MTKFGILSDLHLDFGDCLMSPIEGINYLNAGDTAHSMMFRDLFDKRFPNTCTIEGNHDYYGKSGLPFSEAKNSLHEWNIEGVKIIGASLWTHMASKKMWDDYVYMLNDAYHIRGMIYETYKETYDAHKQFLFDNDADIIIMHHAPSFRSIHPKFANEIVSNKFFANNFDGIILDMKKPPKLIIHGHVHSPFDYMIGKTRVICHPRGYPNENSYYNTYEPKIVEL